MNCMRVTAGGWITLLLALICVSNILGMVEFYVKVV
jgi:hypothetical protein